MRLIALFLNRAVLFGINSCFFRCRTVMIPQRYVHCLILWVDQHQGNVANSSSPRFQASGSMHRLPSNSSIFRFRCSSLLLWISVISFSSGLVVMALGFFHSWHADVLLGGKLVASGLVAYVLEWILSSRARCPLCMSPPLHPKRCQKNRRARRLLGSYRLRVATSVMFRNHFQCPYCGEATKVAVRDRAATGRVDSP